MMGNSAELRQVSMVPVSGSKIWVDAGYLKKNIRYLGPDFEKWFLVGQAKFKVGASDQNRVLLSGALRFGVKAPAILARLGGEVRAESLFSDVLWLLWLEKINQTKYLANNGFANLFFIRDRAGMLRVVNLYQRYCGGWAISAETLCSLRRWDGSDLVFYPFPTPAMSFATRLYSFSC